MRLPRLTAGPRAASRCHAPLFHLHAHVERCIKPDHPARLRQGHHDRRLGGSSVVPGGAGRGAGSVKVRRWACAFKCSAWDRQSSRSQSALSRCWRMRSAWDRQSSRSRSASSRCWRMSSRLTLTSANSAFMVRRSTSTRSRAALRSGSPLWVARCTELPKLVWLIPISGVTL